MLMKARIHTRRHFTSEVCERAIPTSTIEGCYPMLIRYGFVGWMPLGLGFQIKSPKFFGRFTTNRGRVHVRWRGIGGKARKGWEGAARKILRRGREVSKHGTGYSATCTNFCDRHSLSGLVLESQTGDRAARTVMCNEWTGDSVYDPVLLLLLLCRR